MTEPSKFFILEKLYIGVGKVYFLFMFGLDLGLYWSHPSPFPIKSTQMLEAQTLIIKTLLFQNPLYFKWLLPSLYPCMGAERSRHKSYASREQIYDQFMSSFITIDRQKYFPKIDRQIDGILLCRQIEKLLINLHANRQIVNLCVIYVKEREIVNLKQLFCVTKLLSCIIILSVWIKIID